ncbi:MAG: NrdJb, partial [Gammaproteobacteria bacterium]|nr:NrdJb [Gammaproteobacteria bacterium]
MSTIKIKNKIVGYRVNSQQKQEELEKSKLLLSQEQENEANVVRMHERLERPDMLKGTTYKIKPP